MILFCGHHSRRRKMEIDELRGVIKFEANINFPAAGFPALA